MDLYGDLTKTEETTKRHARTFFKQTSANLFEDLPATSAVSAEETSSSKPDTNKRKIACDGEQTVPKKPALDLYALTSFYSERKGERDEMQDAHVIRDDMTRELPGLDPSIVRVSFYAVFDGHAGAKASAYAAQNLHATLITNFPKGSLPVVENAMKKYLIDTYKKTDDNFLKQAKKAKPTWKDGTTATTFLILNNTIYIANLGDSKAILCRFNASDGPGGRYCAIPLTTDHNPSDYTERIRIQKAGGQVREGRVMGQLEVSRSLGDGPYKNHGVSCVPDVKRCQLTEADRWLMIACDGLWKAFTVEKAMDFINQVIHDEAIAGNEFKSAEEVRWETAANKIASESVRRLTADNVTVILIQIHHNDASRPADDLKS